MRPERQDGRGRRVRYDLRLLRPPVDERIEIAPVRAVDDPDDCNYNPQAARDRVVAEGMEEDRKIFRVLVLSAVIVISGVVCFGAFFGWKFLHP